jgi:hypothetical protein
MKYEFHLQWKPHTYYRDQVVTFWESLMSARHPETEDYDLLLISGLPPPLATAVLKSQTIDPASAWKSLMSSSAVSDSN